MYHPENPQVEWPKPLNMVETEYSILHIGAGQVLPFNKKAAQHDLYYHLHMSGVAVFGLADTHPIIQNKLHIVSISWPPLKSLDQIQTSGKRKAGAVRVAYNDVVCIIKTLPFAPTPVSDTQQLSSEQTTTTAESTATITATPLPTPTEWIIRAHSDSKIVEVNNLLTGIPREIQHDNDNDTSTSSSNNTKHNNNNNNNRNKNNNNNNKKGKQQNNNNKNTADTMSDNTTSITPPSAPIDYSIITQQCDNRGFLCIMLVSPYQTKQMNRTLLRPAEWKALLAHRKAYEDSLIQHTSSSDDAISDKSPLALDWKSLVSQYPDGIIYTNNHYYPTYYKADIMKIMAQNTNNSNNIDPSTLINLYSLEWIAKQPHHTFVKRTQTGRPAAQQITTTATTMETTETTASSNADKLEDKQQETKTDGESPQAGVV